ncbi:GDSL-like Lipase/Acylhydrolase family [Corynebacterium mustelae]|uniref:GDSL-like Lipase/Acylhydrolase family n=2 Tax=Corynebacterium mustelae TaxID=571915 RepID=A0A0G3H077_9CORY|nr:GDSL-like Lipase/Acylhydrolase family [Corynebacterium mustelae]
MVVFCPLIGELVVVTFCLLWTIFLYVLVLMGLGFPNERSVVMKSRRFVAAISAVVAGFSSVVAGPVAVAQEKNVVMFGDSVLANPTFLWAEIFQGPGKATKNAPGDWRCPRGESRIAASLQRLIGGKVEDFACTGAVAYAPIDANKSLKKQVDTALNQNQLSPATTNVLIQIGVNDTWKAPGLYHIQSQRFVDEMRVQVGRIKAAAPNARVSFVSYPAMVGPHGETCPFHINNAPAPVIPVGAVRSALNAAHDWQRQSAAATGSDWINIEPETKGHDMCAPQNQRWVAGILDNSTEPYNITTHLTHRGNDEVARILSRHL